MKPIQCPNPDICQCSDGDPVSLLIWARGIGIGVDRHLVSRPECVHALGHYKLLRSSWDGYRPTLLDDVLIDELEPVSVSQGAEEVPWRAAADPPEGEAGCVAYIPGRRAIRSGGTVWIENLGGDWFPALGTPGFVTGRPS